VNVQPVVSFAFMSAIRRALEASGIEFLPENVGGVSVRLRESDP